MRAETPRPYLSRDLICRERRVILEAGVSTHCKAFDLGEREQSFHQRTFDCRSCYAGPAMLAWFLVPQSKADFGHGSHVEAGGMCKALGVISRAALRL